MIIYLGRRLPDASSDLPGSRDGSGRSVGGGRRGTGGSNRLVPSRPFALPPYLVLLPMGFTEPGRSPGLLVSSYLAVSPLPRSRRREATRPRRSISVALSLSVPLSRPGRWALPTIAPCGVRTFLRGTSPGPNRRAGRFPSRHRHSGTAPQRSSRPPRTLIPSYGPRFARTILVGHWSGRIGSDGCLRVCSESPDGRDRKARGVSPEKVGHHPLSPPLAPPQGPAMPGLAAAQEGKVTASSLLGADAPSFTITPPSGGSNCRFGTDSQDRRARRRLMAGDLSREPACSAPSSWRPAWSAG